VEGPKKKTLIEVTMPESTSQTLDMEVTDSISGDFPAVKLTTIHRIPEGKKIYVIRTRPIYSNLMVAIEPQVRQNLKTKGIDIVDALEKAAIEADVGVV